MIGREERENSQNIQLDSIFTIIILMKIKIVHFTKMVATSEYFVVMGCVVVTVAPLLCDGWLWPSPELSIHPVLEQQQKKQNMNS